MTDINASTHDFLDQLSRQAEEFRKEVEAARRERDEAAARLVTLEKRLADSEEALRAMRFYAGDTAQDATSDTETGPANGQGDTRPRSIEEAILQVLRAEDALSPLDIARGVNALGLASPASSVRARLSKLIQRGTLQRDDKSGYSLVAAGTEATQAP
ncbi:MULTISPECIES: hypothetical protein [unclassified Streptomyces]|uniref:hypothetical protein n=1 Tax=unclassified Streptomyces TaxID=2593676 RepID=UPI0023652F2A|nr:MULTISPECIES: hypothetical protein [unclassified Streptomyces]MDF3141709.1 hypothetical protein [Streptomyces sp. T21Q-yed]WDF38897.1 hypothetical protein PBV52_19865 [Streptomyces sp. T12]